MYKKGESFAVALRYNQNHYISCIEGCFVPLYYRQRKLEEGLLFTGQFNEALQALLDWLAKMEPGLADDTPVHGDLETVNGFLEAHKVILSFFKTEK